MKTYKTCIYCEKTQLISNFPKHIMYKDRLDMRCKDCIKEHKQVRRKLHKTAPQKPEVCECCKTKPRKWCLDHDHLTNTFRGWLCERCNTGIGKLGDDLQGITMAMNYLLSRNKS